MQVENYRNILVSRKICEKKEAQYFSFAILERECKKFIFSNYISFYIRNNEFALFAVVGNN